MDVKREMAIIIYAVLKSYIVSKYKHTTNLSILAFIILGNYK